MRGRDKRIRDTGRAQGLFQHFIINMTRAQAIIIIMNMWREEGQIFGIHVEVDRGGPYGRWEIE